MLSKLKKKISNINKSPWSKLESEEDWEQLLSKSKAKPVLLFKHSTRCSLSSMAKGRLERDFQEISEKSDLFLLDLVKHRKLSNQVAHDTGIAHESPQVILIDKGKAVFNSSHNGVSSEAVLTALKDKNL